MYDDVCAALNLHLQPQQHKNTNSLITTVMIIGFYHMSSSFKMLIVTLCDYTDSTYSFLNHTQLYNLSDGRKQKDECTEQSDLLWLLCTTSSQSERAKLSVFFSRCGRYFLLYSSERPHLSNERGRHVLGGVISNLALLPPQPILQSYSDYITHY